MENETKVFLVGPAEEELQDVKDKMERTLARHGIDVGISSMLDIRFSPFVPWTMRHAAKGALLGFCPLVILGPTSEISGETEELLKLAEEAGIPICLSDAAGLRAMADAKGINYLKGTDWLTQCRRATEHGKNGAENKK